MKDTDIIKLNLKNKDLIRVLKKNKQGMTMSAIARVLKTNIYSLKSDFSKLEIKKIIVITDAGSSKLVRLRE